MSAGSDTDGGSSKRGRRPNRPDPQSGPTAEFALKLLALKESAGDPSYDRMRTELGAAASKSALAAAARGRDLPSWETTWEFVKALAVRVNGEDETAARARWQAEWETARTAATSAPEPEAEPESGEPETTERGGSRRLAVVAITVVGLLVLGLGAWWIFWRTPPTDSATPPPSSSRAPVLPPDAARPIPGDSSFLGRNDDVTFPDGSPVKANQRFVKTWRLHNTGSVPWRGRFLDRLPPLGGLSVCQSPSRVPIPDTEPGTAVLINVPAEAPSTPGECKVYWRMVDSAGNLYFPQSTGIFFLVRVVP
ncbi:Ig-like domain-containing protein [Herbihabitans rhizosphaerae]|uniref:Ig-like domain-containing protein n=1 Tax=Herbihabitans rhizosphaerae TaxID=1872711 RepID=A0A4Q7KWZ4_9PSEU|nr:NBR1-Ig-like domain-containing protein [Herbihabitans rhizosphaerae]RZS41126.1 Ig-like domain-containing protein [Herbihabitans rhizosphaerae]